MNNNNLINPSSARGSEANFNNVGVHNPLLTMKGGPSPIPGSAAQATNNQF